MPFGRFLILRGTVQKAASFPCSSACHRHQSVHHQSSFLLNSSLVFFVCPHSLQRRVRIALLRHPDHLIYSGSPSGRPLPSSAISCLSIDRSYPSVYLSPLPPSITMPHKVNESNSTLASSGSSGDRVVVSDMRGKFPQILALVVTRTVTNAKLFASRVQCGSTENATPGGRP